MFRLRLGMGDIGSYTQITHEGGPTACWCGWKGYWLVLLFFSKGGGRRGEGNGCLIIGRSAGVPHKGEGTQWPFIRHAGSGGRHSCGDMGDAPLRVGVGGNYSWIGAGVSHSCGVFFNTSLFFLPRKTIPSHVSYNWTLLCHGHICFFSIMRYFRELCLWSIFCLRMTMSWISHKKWWHAGSCGLVHAI